MKVLNQRYFGSIARCNNCGAILGYEINDIFTNQTILCPVCQLYIPVQLNPNYDGIIKEKEEKENDSMVSE